VEIEEHPTESFKLSDGIRPLHYLRENNPDWNGEISMQIGLHNSAAIATLNKSSN
jgi:hypothetical protein